MSEGSLFLSNTLKRRHQKRQEATKILQEGLSSLHLSSPSNDPTSPPTHDGVYPLLNIDPDSYLLEEGDERSMLEPSSCHDPDFKQTIHVLLNWLNASLTREKILVRSLEEDLYDGYVLGKLIESHQPNTRLLYDDIPLSEDSKRKTLRRVLDHLNNAFQEQQRSIRWTFEQVYSRDFIAILHLLLAMMQLWNVKIRYNLPKILLLKVIVVKKTNGLLQTRIVNECFIDEHERELPGIPSSRDNDLIDTLFDLTPDKLSGVEKALLQFINHHLNIYNIHVPHIDIQYFQDGLNLLYLMSQLEHYFLILSKYHHKKPITREQSFANLQLAFDLMTQAGIDMEKYCRINDLLAGNQRTLYRLLFHLFLRYNADSNHLLQSMSHLQSSHTNADSSLL